MKRILSLTLLLTLVLSFAAFAKGTGETGEVKVLNRYLPAKIAVFNPADITDLYTGQIGGEIMEGLYRYKYTTDNYVLEPAIALDMPEVSADNLTYTFKLRTDAYFYDPLMEVFPDGKGRAVNAHDFALSVKRTADPDTKSGGWWLFDGKIAGLNEWREAAIESGKADYSAEIEGVKALDDTTLQITLTEAFPQILYNFAMTFTWPTIQEAIDYYGEEWVNYPIGTGAYMLDHDNSIPGTQWVHIKNLGFRGQKFPGRLQMEGKARDGGLAASAGKALPFADKVVWAVIEENQPRWLKFMNGELDLLVPPSEYFDQAVVNNEITPEMAGKGIWLDINPTLDVTYTFFNMVDPLFKDNVKLRQAMSLAYDIDKYIEIFDNFRAVPAQSVIPPGLGGYDPDYKNPYQAYDPEKAKQLLAEAGYPNGEGLPVIKYEMYSSSATVRERVEFFANYMKDIGIQMELVVNDWPTFLELIDNKEAQIGGIAWGADYPDAQNFMQLLYGPNEAPGPNGANYNNAEYNRLYAEASIMQPGPKRDRLYDQAAKIAAEEVPWIYGRHRISYGLIQPWLKNRMFRDIGLGYSKYLDIDLEERAARLGQ